MLLIDTDRKKPKSMEQKLIITDFIYHDQEYMVAAAYQEERLMEVNCFKKSGPSILGNIYVGRVKEIAAHLNAAFIEIAPGLSCYYSFEDFRDPVFVKKTASKKRMVQGDEVVVQVVKEGMKTKPPQVTTNLSFTGKYLVLTTENVRLSVSRKIDSLRAGALREIMKPRKKDQYGLILRTNALHAAEDELWKELEELEEQFYDLTQKAAYRTCFSVLFKEKPGFIKCIQSLNMEAVTAIITDEQAYYDEINCYLSRQQTDALTKLRLYEDNSYPLKSLYGLGYKLEDALKKRVWLPSGAYLIIEATEALTVIDVNTGKSAYKKDPQKYYFKTNLEAAKEIARQLRLRNISGIIIVDFIDMTKEEAKEILLDTLRQETRKDSVPVSILGMTKLNLVEITRKKIYKPLTEQLM